jgi:hypothetical protein
MIGLRKGLWYFTRFSRKGSSAKTKGKQTILSTPINLELSMRSKLNVAKKYHSGKISRGVEKGAALSLKSYVVDTDRPREMSMTSRITTGKI